MPVVIEIHLELGYEIEDTKEGTRVYMIKNKADI